VRARAAGFDQSWGVVAGAALCMMVVSSASSSFAAFAEPMATRFGAGRASLCTMIGLAGALTFLLAPAGEWLCNRLGPRRSCFAGVACIAAGLEITSQSQSLAGACVGFAVAVGLGGALTMLPAMISVTSCFQRRRGLAAGLATLGVGLGTIAASPLAVRFEAIWGWSVAMQALAAGIMSIGGPASLLLLEAPLQIGSTVPGKPARSRNGVFAQTKFFRLYLALALVSPALAIPFAHIAFAGRDLGASPATAAALVSLLGAGGLIGRLALGRAADRWGRTTVLGASAGTVGLAYLMWWAATDLMQLAGFALMFGLGHGGVVALLPAACADNTGDCTPRRLGWLYTAAAPGYLLGPIAAGAIVDRGGSYSAVAVAAALASAAACVACLSFEWVRDRRGPLPCYNRPALHPVQERNFPKR